MGQYAETKFLYTAFSTIPMLIAMIGGSRIGKDANADMQGKTNLFEGTWDYFAYLLIAIVLAIAIGFFADSFPVISLGLWNKELISFKN